jgi:hypothetical protein
MATCPIARCSLVADLTAFCYPTSPAVLNTRPHKTGNHRVHPSTRVGVFEVENLSRVPGDACRSVVEAEDRYDRR